MSFENRMAAIGRTTEWHESHQKYEVQRRNQQNEKLVQAELQHANAELQIDELSVQIDNESFTDLSVFIDPIDGTRAFMVGAPTWSNLIGLTHKNQPTLGLANFPVLNKFYFNDQKKSYLINNKKNILATSKESDLRKCKVIGHLHESLFQKKYNKKIKKVISMVSYFGAATFDALNFCLLAEGKVEAVIETNLKPFDIVPVIPIIEKAGGIVTTWDNRSAIQGGNILATSNKKIHNKILKILESSS